MQVFLPYPEFKKSLECLDPTRLGKQIYHEAPILINGGWKNHPAYKIWENHKYMLCKYGLVGLSVLESRDKKYPRWEKWYSEKIKEFMNTGLPDIVGNDKFHASHRSKLLFKGRCDGVHKAINKHIKVKKESITRETVTSFEQLCAELNEPITNWYSKFSWNEPDDLDYIWRL